MWWKRNPDPIEDFNRRRNLRRLGIAAAVLAALYGAARLLERASPRWRGLTSHPLETLRRPAAALDGGPTAPWQGGTGLGTLPPDRAAVFHEEIRPGDRRPAEEGSWRKELRPVDQRPTDVQSWFKAAPEAETKTDARVDGEPARP